MANQNPIKRIFELYTSDLSYQEIERLVKRDAAEVYEFFASEIPKPDPSQNKFTRTLIFIRSLFNAFLLKLTAARRIFYLISLIFGFVGIVNDQDGYVILAFLIINALLAFELADKLTSKNEIDLARKIQNELMPKTPPENPFYDVAAFYESAKEVGGDYFDVIPAGANKEESLLVIGDISGKGMAAALYMVRVQAIVHSLVRTTSDPKEIIINLKNTFSEKLLPEYFLTLITASIKSDGSISMCKAGHPPVLYFNKASNEIETINLKGMGIGLNDKGLFEKTIEVKSIKPSSGDILLFYTDGITAAMNIFKAEFGIDKLKAVLIENANLSANEIKQKIISAVYNFRGDTPQFDDITLIVLKAK
ncbi:MAG: PP2C family protein-serine/threonine phosphatase [Melioribacteraceae bacterium]|nr:MAG: PP2C family protein-serine/threonine phosphatase [Melioribacteraceae bacterium]